MRSALLTLGALVASVIAAPSTPRVQHEKRDFLPPGWRRYDMIPSHEILPMRFALTQNNLDRADEFLMDVSHPDSPNFGKHWTAKQVAETFAPSQESVDIVTGWLTASGIAPERIKISQSMGWLTLNASVAEAEELLKTRYYIHKHKVTGKPHIGCSEYSVPEHVRPHLDFITPTVHFDTRVPQSRLPKREPNEDVLEKRQTSLPVVSPTTIVNPSTTAAVGRPVQSKAAVDVIQEPTSGFLPKKGATLDVSAIAMELANCNEFITPDCLRALYRFPPNFAANRQNSYG